MQGRPISEAPRDGTVINVSVMRIAGVPDTGHYSFYRMRYWSPPPHGFEGWHPVDQGNMTYGESTILAWWPDGTPEDQMEKRPRTNFKWRPSNGTGGMAFYEQFCEQCVFERPYILDENAEGCGIFLRTMVHDISDPEYPEEWTDRDGHPRCTKFSRFISDDIAPRCDQTPDLFK